jgi:hypothetical protein
MPTKKKLIKKLVLYTGYVESGSIACVLMQHINGFATLKEALTHIGQAMKAVIEYHARERMQECCKKNKDAKFCPECGSLIQTGVDAEDVSREFMDFFHGTADDTHDHYEFLDAGGWLFYGDDFVFDKSVVWITERAEELIGALGVGDEEAFKFASQFVHNVEFE